jgi:Rod binding domain-containing protein
MSPDASTALSLNTALMNSAAATNKPLATPKATGDIAAAKKSAQDFEAVFINEMLSPMFEGLQTDGMFGGGESEGIFRSMMVDQYSKTIAAQGGLGLSNNLTNAILKMQGLHPDNSRGAAKTGYRTGVKAAASQPTAQAAS